ncbi:sulfate permease, SulP family [Paenibacillus sp. UNCCL117]|uniref:SulP family inorganic anion transporter n=1 Tax=unclassified Paenibacillus TaxID=185978 RepID=UPI000883CE1B|nr:MULTISPECIES: SulP family inorganic anion transporter [unclassified Paenibacillus]SDD86469.1 sulfate permease, SulP family [Paenibacillus sp. cl123]SFW54155.1 sulfate permease, SulP family [Paenibacillus sp. UNCCL117]
MNKQLNSNGWFSNTRLDMLSGITVALALIPEAIAFSIIAGVDPMVGLYASFSIAVVIAFTGGRPGMISAATGAMALLMVNLVKDHGLEYLFAATVLAGVLQVILGMLRLGQLVSFVPHSVMTGFVNALAILIFMAQLTHFTGAGWLMYALVALTLVIIYGLPRLTKAVPSALVAIIVVSLLVISLGLDVKTVGDMGKLTSALPVFHLPQVLLSLDTLWIILPYSISLAMVGILESLLTATIVDEMTDTTSDKNREVKGQGVANIVTGFFGGMAGCAMIGQSVINVKSGGRTRLSTLVAGVFLLFLIIVLGDVVKQIPMAALVGVMIMVSVGTFDWSSVIRINKLPLSDAVVMLVTVSIVVATHDLSYGVFAGVILSAVIFAWKMSKIRVASSLQADGSVVYRVSGPVFFGTVSALLASFAYQEDPKRVVVDLTGSHVWDHSAVTALSKTIAKYRSLGKEVTLIGLNEESRTLIDRTGLSIPQGH